MDLDDNATCFIREFDITWSLRRRLHRRLGVNHQHRDRLGSAGADLLGGFKQSSQITQRVLRWFQISESLAGAVVEQGRIRRDPWHCGSEVSSFGRNWQSSPLVFSFDPRCQGLWESQ